MVVADGGGGCDWLLKFVVDVFIIILMVLSSLILPSSCTVYRIYDSCERFIHLLQICP